MRKFGGRTTSILTYVTLGCLGLILGLVLLEAGLHLIPRQNLDELVDKSTRLDLYRLDPRIGWSLKPNVEYVHITHDDEPIPIQTNSRGLRDGEYTYQKPEDVFRIMMLGDSFTEAFDVRMEESFPYQVEKCLSQYLATPVEVINTGVSGYGPGEQYLFFKHEGVKYEPDLVLLVTYVGNDFANLGLHDEQRLVKSFGGYRFSLGQGNLSQDWVSWEHPYLERVSALELFLRRHSRLYRIVAHPESKVYESFQELAEEWLGLLQTDKTNASSPEPLPWELYIHVEDFPDNPIVPSKTREVWTLFQAIVQQLKIDIEAEGGQLAMAIIPTEYQVHPDIREETIVRFANRYDFPPEYERAWRTGEPNHTMVTALEQQTIPTLDLLSYFQAHDEAGGSLLYFDGGYPQHLNRDGQRLMGDVMCDWLWRNEAVRLPR